MIRVRLPEPLQRLGMLDRETWLDLEGPISLEAVLDELETRFPALEGTIRDRATRERRAFIRFFADGIDLSLEPMETLLPPSIVSGSEPLIVLGAMAGG